MSESKWRQLMRENYAISESLLELALEVSNSLASVHQRCDSLALANQARVMEAFHHARLASDHLAGSTGYGYDDLGRQKACHIFARVFGAPAAIVSPHIISGTHALTLCLSAVLRPGDTVLSVTGTPYDTLESVLGIRPTVGSLAEYGISYLQCNALELSDLDLDTRLQPPVKLAYIQRSGGYGGCVALSIAAISQLIARIKRLAPQVVTLVDNCYGEFVAEEEPGHRGADLTAGSLIKNPGGGVVESGGYIAGRQDLIDRVAARLTVPGQGVEVGSYLPGYRSILQGIFVAPTVVAGALRGAAFAAGLLEALGFSVRPRPLEMRGDIIQAVDLTSPAALKAFCRGVQKASPVDAQAHPEPWAMPGYEHPIIMAAGTFVQGASIELTADARFTPPYTVYLQGGLSYQHVQCAVLVAASELLADGPLTPC